MVLHDNRMMSVDFAENAENRCPIVLLLDTSSSMAGQPIDELNKGVQLFKEEVEKDNQASLSVEIEIIIFGGEKAEVFQEFVTIDNFFLKELTVSGRTPMGAGINLAIKELNKRKQIYKENDIMYYRPWIILLSDGSPTDEWKPAAEKLKEEESLKRLTLYAVAIGNNANIKILSEIAGDKPPVRLHGLEFQKMFKWLSASVKRVSSSAVGETIEVPPVDWGKPVSIS